MNSPQHTTIYVFISQIASPPPHHTRRRRLTLHLRDASIHSIVFVGRKRKVERAELVLMFVWIGNGVGVGVGTVARTGAGACGLDGELIVSLIERGEDR